MASTEKGQLKIAVIALAFGMSLISGRPARAGESPASTQIHPTIESVSDTLAFIRWVTSNPGGTILHTAVVQYGTDPGHLDRTAKSPTRINPAHGEMVFRVRVSDLKPGTTYYYRVFSEQANGASDPGTSTLNQFTTRTGSEAASNK